jgi:hypothetical protein
MIRLILLNHESGAFFEAFTIEELEKLVRQELKRGADLDNLKVYRSESLKISESTTTETKTSYKFYKP